MSIPDIESELRRRRALGTAQNEGNPQGVLAQAVRELKVGPLTPELVTKTFRTIWQVRGESVDLEIVVSTCDRSAEELVELVKAGRHIGYLPEQLRTPQDLTVLAKIFPRLGSRIEEDYSLVNEVDRFGWFDYEASVYAAPYLNTTEDQLRKAIAIEGKRLGRDLVGMNVNEYIVAGEDSELFTGKVLDNSLCYRARLLGSRDGSGHVVRALFPLDVGLYVYWGVNPDYKDPYLGGRSVGVKKSNNLSPGPQ